MNSNAMARFVAFAKQPDVYEQTALYVREHLAEFMRPQERVLLCFQKENEHSIAALMERAVLDMGGLPQFWGPERSWQSLLRQAFFGRVTVIVGPPLVMLGLSKVARETGTPLKVRNVLLAGAPCEDWMIEGIRNGFDARIWGLYDPVPGLVVAGFSCQKSAGVHIRRDVLQVCTLDAAGNDAPEGEIVISPVGAEDILLHSGIKGRLVTQPCLCGSKSPRLVDVCPVQVPDQALAGLKEYLLSWSSVLDYRAVRTDMGLELEVVAFPGQRLPKLPSCAKLVVRPWIPKHDAPFCLKDTNF